MDQHLAKVREAQAAAERREADERREAAEKQAKIMVARANYAEGTAWAREQRAKEKADDEAAEATAAAQVAERQKRRQKLLDAVADETRKEYAERELVSIHVAICARAGRSCAAALLDDAGVCNAVLATLLAARELDSHRQDSHGPASLRSLRRRCGSKPGRTGGLPGCA